MNNKKNIIWAALVSVAAVLSVLLCLSAAKGDALVLGLDRDAQSDLFPDFFTELKAGNHDEAMSLVANYDSLGFEKNSSELVELYKSKLIDSYSVSVVNPNSGEQEGLYGKQVIDLTFLDSRKLLASINEKTTVAVNDYLYYGNKLESDEQALSFVYDALNQSLETTSNYLSTERLTVQTVYENGRWQIIIDDSFLNAMQGYISSAAEGTVISYSDVVSTTDIEAAEEATGNE